MAYMIALRSFPYAGKRRKKGERFRVRYFKDTKALIALNLAEVAEDWPMPEIPKSYLRRDMTPEPVAIQAEPVAEPLEAPDPDPVAAQPEPVEKPVDSDPISEPVEISPRTGLPKRQYRRRDMSSTE